MASLLSLSLFAALLPTSVWAQQFQQGPSSLTIEGFANLTGGYAKDSDDFDDGLAGHAFGELRAFAVVDTGHDLLIGARLTLQGEAGSKIDDGTRIGEASLILMGSWGRLELGDRRGLPDVLTGYAPNNYQFVSAEYGPASGPSLDPDGGLQTVLLDTVLARQLNALTGQGITASFFADESTKIIYVLPKTKGFLGGLSYAPRVDGTDGRFRDLVQSGLTWERYWGQNVVRVGGTYTFANGQNTEAGAQHTDDLHSLGLGTTVTLKDALTLGVSLTYNGNTGLTGTPGPMSISSAYGYAASVSYNTGAWTFGGFFQTARGEGDTTQSGGDELNALQLGLSYRSSTHTRLFTSLYLYRFNDESGVGDFGKTDGAIAQVGIRLNF